MEDMNQVQGEPQTEMQNDAYISEEMVIKEKPIKSNRRAKLITIIVVVLLVLLLIFRIFQSSMGAEEQHASLINVKTASVELTSIYTTSPITGRIEPIEEVNIIPLASGEITSVNVALGDQVKKGTVLFQIDKTQISTTLNQASSGYNTAKSAYDRISMLYNEGAVSLQDYESARAQYIAAKESYTSASDAYNNCIVTSPINGYVTSLTAAVGGIASSAMSQVTVANISELQISTTVSEYLISEIKVGDPVEIYIASLGNNSYKGIIKALSPAPATGTLTYPITISVNDDSGKIMAGMFAEIEIIANEKDKVLCIPSDAVIIKAGESIAVVLEKDIPVFKKVTTGIDNGEYVEITSGLSEGEIVIISGQQYVTEGVSVNIIKE